MIDKLYLIVDCYEDQRYLLSLRRFLLFQLALLLGLILLSFFPLILSPLPSYPALVNPLISLCLCCGLQIQLNLASFLIALWAGSTQITS